MSTRKYLGGYTRLVFFDPVQGFRIDIDGSFALAESEIPSGDTEMFEAADGGEYPIKTTRRVSIAVFEGGLLEAVERMQRMSENWNLVAYGYERHIQFYEATSLKTVPAREGFGGMAADRVELSYTGSDPEVGHSDNLLEFLGWSDCIAESQGSGDFILYRSIAGGLKSDRRALNWDVNCANGTDRNVSNDLLTFGGSFSITSPLMPLPTPGTVLRLTVPSSEITDATITFWGIDGVTEIEDDDPPSALLSVEGQTTVRARVPLKAFFAQVEITGGGALLVGRPRLTVDFAGPSVPDFEVVDEFEAPAGGMVMMIYGSPESGDTTGWWIVNTDDLSASIPVENSANYPIDKQQGSGGNGSFWLTDPDLTDGWRVVEIDPSDGSASVFGLVPHGTYSNDYGGCEYMDGVGIAVKVHHGQYWILGLDGSTLDNVLPNHSSVASWLLASKAGTKVGRQRSSSFHRIDVNDVATDVKVHNAALLNTTDATSQYSGSARTDADENYFFWQYANGAGIGRCDFDLANPTSLVAFGTTNPTAHRIGLDVSRVDGKVYYCYETAGGEVQIRRVGQDGLNDELVVVVDECLRLAVT